MSTDSTSAPAKPELYYVNVNGQIVFSPADAVGIHLRAHDGTAGGDMAGSNPARMLMYALYGAMALARETIKRNPHAPAAALNARLAAVSTEPLRWGDEKPAKQSPAERKALRDAAALDELVDVVRTVKTRLSLAFDEAKFRARCATEEGFQRKAKSVPDVKAEIARRAEGPSADGVGVDTL